MLWAGGWSAGREGMQQHDGILDGVASSAVGTATVNETRIEMTVVDGRDS